MIEEQLKELLSRVLAGTGRITFLTGAGVSAESGIPTFRGPEGYWTIGSRNYQPHEIATCDMFQRHPHEVWKWYLYRRSVCRRAEPNAGHVAISDMESILGRRFRLLTQNVDGLHLRAGNSPARTYQIHGNLHHMRCARSCSDAVYPIPEQMPDKKRESDLRHDELALLVCPACGELSRPHVLLWDEQYNERHYQYESSLQAARQTDLLIVVGTAGATNLPNQVAAEVLRRGKPIIDLNLLPNVFSRAAGQSAAGFFWQAASARALPGMADMMRQIA